MKVKNKFKKGAASFYIVAFSALILLIVATSFASIIISELTRTSNEDLSQSAYDSALAGVEDAKLAYYSYQNCVAQNGTGATGGVVDCDTVKEIIEKPENQNCDMVANILGRGAGEVSISELKGADAVKNNMQQAYTCVEIQTKLEDYRSTLSSTNQMRVIKTNFASDVDGHNVANDIVKVKINWFSDKGAKYAWTNAGSETGGSVAFWQTGYKLAATPPTISVAMVQTAKNFNLSDFDLVRNDGAVRTDRAMVYLVPTNVQGLASRSDGNYKGAWNGSENVISDTAMQKSNDKTTTNLPYAVYCISAEDDEGHEFACSATLYLPKPISGVGGDERNPDTFEFIVSLPYGKPMTDFSMEFFCADGVSKCGYQPPESEGSAPAEEGRAYLDSVQVKIDSTGRANDLYRRVESRLETAADSSYLSVMGPLELMGGDSGEQVLKKVEAVRCEYNFNPTCR